MPAVTGGGVEVDPVDEGGHRSGLSMRSSDREASGVDDDVDDVEEVDCSRWGGRVVVVFVILSDTGWQSPPLFWTVKEKESSVLMWEVEGPNNQL